MVEKKTTKANTETEIGEAKRVVKAKQVGSSGEEPWREALERTIAAQRRWRWRVFGQCPRTVFGVVCTAQDLRGLRGEDLQ